MNEALIEGMSLQEKQLFRSIIEQTLSFSGQKKEATKLRDIVPIREWLNSTFFVGPMKEDLFDFWKDEITDFVEQGRSEWVITGCIGGGKTTAAEIAMVRKLYELSCYDIPQRLFGIGDLAKIAMSYISVAKYHARTTGFDKLKTLVDNIPYFKKHCKRDTKLDSLLVFHDQGIFVLPGSTSQHVISTDLLCVLFDEANFTKTGGGNPGDTAKAQDIYDETTSRRKSRFLDKGSDPGFSIIVSSSTHQTSFTAGLIARADKSTKVTTTRAWEVRPAKYNPERFWVFIGTPREDPFCVSDVIDLRPVLEARHVEPDEYAEESDPDKVIRGLPHYIKDLFIEVPTDLRRDFERNTVLELRNAAGISAAPSGKLFTSVAAYEKCLSLSGDLRSPFTKESFTVSLRREGEILDYFIPEVLFSNGSLIRHPYSPRFIHIDQSISNDKTGVTCVHLADFKEDQSTGIRLPAVELDFWFRIEPPPAPDRISLAKLRRFIFHLKQDLGMPIALVTTDQFQSEDHHQILEVNGIPSRKGVNSAKDTPFLSFIELIYSQRFLFYESIVFRRELFNLEHDRVKQRVDHPNINMDGSEGTKDIIDSAVGATYECMQGLQGMREARDKIRRVSEVERYYPKAADTMDVPSWILPNYVRKVLK